MHSNRAHPLLEQVPLTVSPFVHLPRASILPYRYKTMPSSLPATLLDGPAPAAPPDDILASCQALSDHLARLQADADAELRQFEARIAARDLAEKRRLAPGWLDSDERLLVPQKQSGGGGSSATTEGLFDSNSGSNSSNGNAAAVTPSEMAAPVPAGTRTAEETAAAAAVATTAATTGISAEALDQAFGTMHLAQ